MKSQGERRTEMEQRTFGIKEAEIHYRLHCLSILYFLQILIIEIKN